MKIREWKRWVVGAGVSLALLSPAIAQKPPLYTKWENYTTANGMPDEKVLAVTVDGDRVWAGTESGLVLIEKGQIKRVFTPQDGLVNRVVTGIAVDKQTGDVWIATFGGVSQYSGGTFKNYTNLTSGLANDITYGVAIQGDYVWVATTAGISRLNIRTGEWTIVSEKVAPMHEPWSYGIAVAEKEKKVYFAVWGGGVLEYDIAGDYWKPYTDPDEEMEIVLFKNQGLIHIIVSNVAYNADTKMFWASTYFGLSGYDGRYWHNYLSTDSGLASDFINAPKSRGDEVWACTDKGLSYLNYKTNTWVTYRPKSNTGRGEIVITGPDNKATKLETATSLAHNYILNMDFQGEDIWVATARGLSHGMRESNKEGKPHDHSTSGN
ncbi:MAG: regulator [Candidatus Acidiferrales bacterium]|jgi:ligand-binding sensor domain-containing protein